MDALQSIANCVDLDVEQIRAPKSKSQIKSNDELNHRQHKLRKKLDALLEDTHRHLFPTEEPSESSRRKRKSRKQRDDHLDFGIRLFKEVPPGTPVDLSKPIQKSVTKKRKVKTEDSYCNHDEKDGVTRFQGLAVIDTETILNEANKLKEQGRIILQHTSTNQL
eukprot:g7639.t1